LPGTASGTEFTGFTGSGTTVPITITAPATVGLSFPAVPSAPAAQKRPPWVGAPLPATGLAAAPASASGSSSGSSGQSGFPIWVAVVVLLVLGAGAVIFERYRRAREKVSPAAVVPAPNSQRRDDDVASTAAPAHEAAEGTEGVGAVRPAATAPVATEVGDASSPVDVPEALNVLGAREVVVLEIDSDWALLIELFTYLVFHEHRHLKAAQIAIGLRPSGSRELDEKTVRNALTRLRRCVGAVHLPEATTDGYLLVGIPSDWARFQRLSRQADTTGGEEAISLRQEALALVRGAPFADVNDEWIDAERLRSHMTVAIVKCAERLAADLLEANRPVEAEEAATAGLRGAPRHYVLWELGAWAICDQSDRGRLQLWMSDAKANLDDEDFSRLERSVADHRGPAA
jgi:hypothetical protein